ncbi:radical SAM protein, partial [bacterium]|nr:radical SAM protein [bacterium]
MQERLRFSRFAHFWERDDIIAIFHALNRQVLFVDSELFPLIQNSLVTGVVKGSESITQSISCLKNYGLLVPINKKEEMEIKKIQDRILQRPCIDTLYLVLTDECNFGCTYCFFEGSYNLKLGHTVMSVETALSSLQKFVTYLQRAYEFPDFHPREPGIVLYGGEPLLNPKVFCSVIEEVDRLKRSSALPSETKININTNGSLITPEIAIFCAKHEVEVDVSIDGYQSVHDICRVWRKERKGTFFEVVKGVSVLKQAHANVCISCTVSEA